MNDINTFMLGFGMGVTLILVIILLLPPYNLEMANTALEQCEQSLPRNQSCKITAVVNNETRR